MRRAFAALLIVSVSLTLAFGGVLCAATIYQASTIAFQPLHGFQSLNSQDISDMQDKKMAFVEPIFTDAAYNNSFYVFFAKYAGSNETYITTDLNYLNVTIKSWWSWSDQLRSFLASDKAKEQGLFLGKNLVPIDDINVTEGGLFRDGKRAYDLLILGFTEYVTSAEYYAYKDFVAQGGTIIILDSCNFQCEVKYSPPSTPNGVGHMSLVKGKGWEFNGTAAWKSVYGRWEQENRNWIGSNYWFYWTGKHYDYFIANTSDPISTYLRDNYGEHINTTYGAHEESILENFTDTSIIGYWHFIKASEAPNQTIYPGEPVAAFQHRYMNGSVFRYGIMASDRIATEEFLQAFLISAIRVGLFGQVGIWHFPRNITPSASLTFSRIEGGPTDPKLGLYGIISCLITLNDAYMASGGVIFNLTSVSLEIYRSSTYSSWSDLPFQELTIQSQNTDNSGLCWQAIINTTAIPDGEYAFEVDSSFVSSVNNANIKAQSLSIRYFTISNSTPLANSILMVTELFVALILVLALIGCRRAEKRESATRKAVSRRRVVSRTT